MPTLSVTKTYADLSILSESDLDGIKLSIEAFFNVTKIDDTNIQTEGVGTASIAALAITTAKIATDAVTATKLDQTDDYEVNSLKIGATGVTVVKGASNQFELDGSIYLSNSASTIQLGSSGPVISNNSNTYLNSSLPLRYVGSGGGITLDCSVANQISTSANAIRLNASANGATIRSAAASLLQIRNGSTDAFLGNAVVSDATDSGSGWRIIGGSVSLTSGVSVTFASEGFSNFASTPFIAVVPTSFEGAWSWALTAASTSAFTVTHNQSSPRTFHWIAVGQYV